MSKTDIQATSAPGAILGISVAPEEKEGQGQSKEHPGFTTSPAAVNEIDSDGYKGQIEGFEQGLYNHLGLAIHREDDASFFLDSFCPEQISSKS